MTSRETPMNYKTPIACALLLCLTASPRAAAPAVPFAPGEVLTYDVSWTSFVTAGGATLSVKERRGMGGGREAYYIVAEAKPTSMLDRLYHLYYKAESLLDTESLRPSHATVFSDERGRTRRLALRFLPNDIVDYEVKTATLVKSQFQALPASLDGLAALYVIRTLPLKAGLLSTLPLVDKGKNYRLRLNVEAREPVKTGLGSLPAWRIAIRVEDERGGPASTRNMTLWVSDDARRLPLKVEVDLPVGSFRLTLAARVSP
jgi:hypothetical protein